MIYRHYAVFAILILLTSIFTISLASAGIDDWFRTITGRATANADANVTLQGNNNVTVLVWNFTLTGAEVTPSAGTYINVTFNVTLYDADGSADINTSTLEANLTRAGEPLRFNNTCEQIETFGDAINFTCTIDMWYFDEPGVWTISASAVDLGTGNRVTNDTEVFNYQTLNSISSSLTLVSFGSVSQGDQNQSASNDPLVLNNTGNVDFTNLSVNASNLVGETVDTNAYIDVANLSVSNSTSGTDGGARDECIVGSNNGIYASTLVNRTTFVQVQNATLSRGNLSLNDGTAQEQLYFCIRTVPSGIPSQPYSTAAIGNWVVNTG